MSTSVAVVNQYTDEDKYLKVYAFGTDADASGGFIVMDSTVFPARVGYQWFIESAYAISDATFPGLKIFDVSTSGTLVFELQEPAAQGEIKVEPTIAIPVGLPSNAVAVQLPVTTSATLAVHMVSKPVRTYNTPA